MKLLIVDDHPVFTYGLSTALRSVASELKLVDADSARSAIAAFARERPDVVLLDMVLPDGSGLDVIAAVRRLDADVPIIVLTSLSLEAVESKLGATRVSAVLQKEASMELIVQTLRRVASFGSDTTCWPVQVDGTIEPLTPREQEVVQLMARGDTNRAIAHSLEISVETVKDHVSSVLRKLGAANRSEAVAIVVRSGIVNDA